MDFLSGHVGARTAPSPSSFAPVGGTFNDTTAHNQPALPQLAILDFFFPGFSTFTATVQQYMGIDLNIYIPLIAVLGGLMVTWRK